MSDYLDKKSLLFERGSNSELLPCTIMVELMPTKPKIDVLPIKKGELAGYLNKLKSDDPGDVEAEIISKHCIKPDFTIDEARAIKYDKGQSDAILVAILNVSTGKSQLELKTMFENKKDSDVENFTMTPQT